MLWYCDAQTLLFPSYIADFTINLPEQFMLLYMVSYGMVYDMVILDHQNIGVDIFSVLSCLV